MPVQIQIQVLGDFESLEITGTVLSLARPRPGIHCRMPDDSQALGHEKQEWTESYIVSRRRDRSS